MMDSQAGRDREGGPNRGVQDMSKRKFMGGLVGLSAAALVQMAFPRGASAGGGRKEAVKDPDDPEALREEWSKVAQMANQMEQRLGITKEGEIEADEQIRKRLAELGFAGEIPFSLAGDGFYENVIKEPLRRDAEWVLRYRQAVEELSGLYSRGPGTINPLTTPEIYRLIQQRGLLAEAWGRTIPEERGRYERRRNQGKEGSVPVRQTEVLWNGNRREITPIRGTYLKYVAKVAEFFSDIKAVSDVSSQETYPVGWVEGSSQDDQAVAVYDYLYHFVRVYWARLTLISDTAPDSLWTRNIPIHEVLHSLYPSENNPTIDRLPKILVLEAYRAMVDFLVVRHDEIEKKFAWIRQPGLYDNLGATRQFYALIADEVLGKLLVEKKIVAEDVAVTHTMLAKVEQIFGGRLGNQSHAPIGPLRSGEQHFGFFDMLGSNGWTVDDIRRLDHHGRVQFGEWLLETLWQNSRVRKELFERHSPLVFMHHFHFNEIITFVMTDVISNRGVGCSAEEVNMTNAFLALGQNDPPRTVETMHDAIEELIKQTWKNPAPVTTPTPATTPVVGGVSFIAEPGGVVASKLRDWLVGNELFYVATPFAALSAACLALVIAVRHQESNKKRGDNKKT